MNIHDKVMLERSAQEQFFAATGGEAFRFSLSKRLIQWAKRWVMRGMGYA